MSPVQRTSIVGGLVALLITMAAPAFAQDPSDHDFVVLTGGAVVAEGRSVGSLVVFDGDVRIEGTVEESAVVFNGDVTIAGTVTEDLIVFNGDVRLLDGAAVEEDVISLREPVVAPGATIGGEDRRLRHFDFDWRFGFAARFAWWLAISASTLLLGFLLGWLAPRAVERMAVVGNTRRGGSFGYGVLLFIGIPIIAIIALATVIGIPFGLGTLLLIAPLFSLGYVTTGWVVGRQLSKTGSRAAAYLIGWAVLRGLALIPVVGGIVWFLATVFGLGVLLLSIVSSSRPAPEPTVAPAGEPV
ncbi:MAG: hypothetical protein ACRDLB_10505 [Actinomycetota bacterium]